MKFEDYMSLEPDEASRIAESGEKIVFDKDTLNSIYGDIRNELDSLPAESEEPACTVLAQLLLLAKEALRAINLHGSEEVLKSLYEMLKAYYKACEERELGAS